MVVVMLLIVFVMMVSDDDISIPTLKCQMIMLVVARPKISTNKEY
jgi:hypothetical protein